MNTFSLLHVCVANICRSPMAERLTRQEIAGRLGPASRAFRVRSAGTRGLVGQPMHHHGAHLLRSVGADPDDFVAHRLTPEILAGADLVLAATATERDRAVSMLPAALRTTFTLREFARLLDGLPPGALEAVADPVDRARVTVSRARSMRGRVPYVEPVVDDVVDPPRTPEGFRACLASIRPAVRTIVAVLCGEPSVPQARTPSSLDVGR
jgi:protein-tyrosine phosphatase